MCPVQFVALSLSLPLVPHPFSLSLSLFRASRDRIIGAYPHPADALGRGAEPRGNPEFIFILLLLRSVHMDMYMHAH